MNGMSRCPIDAQFPDQVSALLKPPSNQQVQEFFDELLKSKNVSGLRVQQTGSSGKGVYAETDFEEDSLVLKEQMLAGIQHSSNKIDCLVCSFCFRFIGSVEVQIGRKLYLQSLADSLDDFSDGKTVCHHQKDCCDLESCSSEDDSENGEHENLGACSSNGSKERVPVPMEAAESLMNGDLQLPYSKEFPLPEVISCIGGCEEVHYCSKSCAEADWDMFHSLLCTGEASKALSKEALSEFMQHSNETNDIFFLAAKVISSTILKYRKLKAARHDVCGARNVSSNSDISLLLEAWKPISMGYKKRWWDCVALPDDVDAHNGAAFRMQIREMAFESLQLLKAAIFDEECAPLFSLEIYGHIIGMFELNNLDLVVESPVEDYFLYIDDLPDTEKKEADDVTRPFLDALGEDYSVCCEGTAFFSLQSCMNHSCDPNAKAFKREEDRDGQATIIACRPIGKGEEITISYIDEDLPYEERQALLADYGFKCRCSKCLKEEAQSKTKNLKKGKEKKRKVREPLDLD